MGKKYIDGRGWKYRVMGGLGVEYKARYQKPDKTDEVGWHGVRTLPWRTAEDEAQMDLDELAKKKGWAIWTEN